MNDILHNIAKAHKKLSELEREYGGSLYDIRHALWEAEKEIKRLDPTAVVPTGLWVEPWDIKAK